MVKDKSSLAVGQKLSAGESLLSPLGNYRLLMQLGGNLAVYHRATHGIIWSSGTVGEGNWAVLQGDGNFVLYNATGDQALWHSQSGRVGVDSAWFIVLQDDSNLVIYHPPLQPIWSSLGGVVD